ncbi:MAG: hypothetical protein M3P39_02705, partial [Actinomycetota bacterium]|nr:hypothetical protein [Actinomycetota bacterium]
MRVHPAATHALTLLALLLALLGLPGPAPAQGPGGAPEIAQRPQIVGEPVVGTTLTASDAAWAGGAPSFVWFRCNESGRDCASVQLSASTTYVVREADVGRRIIVALVVIGPRGRASATSDFTEPVAAAPVRAPAAPAPGAPPAPG